MSTACGRRIFNTIVVNVSGQSGVVIDPNNPDPRIFTRMVGEMNIGPIATLRINAANRMEALSR
jgi:hypothetical protein